MLKYAQQHKKNARSVNPGHPQTTTNTATYEENNLLNFFFEIMSIKMRTPSLIKGARYAILADTANPTAYISATYHDTPATIPMPKYHAAPTIGKEAIQDTITAPVPLTLSHLFTRSVRTRITASAPAHVPKAALNQSTKPLKSAGGSGISCPKATSGRSRSKKTKIFFIVFYLS